MKKPCDCDDKPAGAPSDSLRSAAGLWVSSGRVLGYSDATERDAKYLNDNAESILDAAKADLTKKQRRLLAVALRDVSRLFLAGQEARKTEGEVLRKTALAMVERLEQQKGRSFRERLTAVLVALRG